MTAGFYDQLAPFYHLLYADWERSADTQGRALDALLGELGLTAHASIHDAAAGIGTQTIGLLRAGYKVSASDISPGAIARLRQELNRLSLNAAATVDDMRVLSSVATGSQDAVIACDNSISHLLSDDEILLAFQQCWRCLAPGGVAVFSVRDYSSIERKSPDVRPYGLRQEHGQPFSPCRCGSGMAISTI